MGRPPVRRWIGIRPPVTLFKPAGVPAGGLEVVGLDLDELEAMRLVDGEGLGQVEAAARMRISRATVGRILERGRRKVALALVSGRALAIAQGPAPVRYAAPPAERGGPRRRRGRHGHGGGRR